MKRHYRKSRFQKLPVGVKLAARPSRWGNPFKVSEYGQEGAVEMYRRYLADNPKLVALAKRELSGCAGLACYCKPDQACHVDVLIEEMKR